MNVLDELIESDSGVDRTYVERRVDDWRLRIDRLYDDIADWLPERWTVSEGGSVPMREELMQRFDLPARDMPVLSLHRDGSALGRLEPRGLWIIGANGRIDLILPDEHFLFVDRSDSFESPDWQVASIENRRNQRPLSQDLIRDILR